MLHFYERINDDDDDDEMNVIYLNADPMHYLARLANCVLPLSISDDLAYTVVL